MRFYEVQKCWVYNMLLSIFDVCCTHKVRIKVEKERERLQFIGLNIFNEIPVLLMNTMIKPWKNLLYYGEIENQFLIENTFFMQYSRNRLIKNHTAWVINWKRRLRLIISSYYKTLSQNHISRHFINVWTYKYLGLIYRSIRMLNFKTVKKV